MCCSIFRANEVDEVSVGCHWKDIGEIFPTGRFGGRRATGEERRPPKGSPEKPIRLFRSTVKRYDVVYAPRDVYTPAEARPMQQEIMPSQTAI